MDFIRRESWQVRHSKSEPSVKLIFLHGMPGVGKFTVARQLGKLTGFKLFHNHLTVDLVGSVFAFGSQQFVELRERIWLEVFSQAAEAGLDGLIFTFAYDRSVSSGFIENVRNVLGTSGGEVLFVELTCTPEELERRITDRSRQRFGKLTSLDQFRQLNKGGSFIDPGIPAERLVLDTTHLNPSVTAATIVRELGLVLVPATNL